MPLISSEQERVLLETCVAECKRRLDHFRRIGDKLQTELAEADLDRMLDELQNIYRRLGRTIRR